MKKYLAFILVVGAFILISPFKVSAATEEEWSQKLDLSDSVSTSVIKLDDGIVMMKYEGGDSINSTLTKYDFNGNEVWSIKNEYGYEMGSLGNCFIVYATSPLSVTKISSDGKIVWSKEYDDYLYSGSRLIDLDEGFLIEDNYDIYLYDDNGALLKTISENDITASIFGTRNNSVPNLAVSLSNDKKSILVFITCYRSITGGTTGYYHAVAKYSLDLNYKSSIVAYTGNQSFTTLTKIVETENNYIVTGDYTIVFNKQGQIDKALNLSMLDIQYIDGNIYAYVVKKSNEYCIYDVYVGKYDENMKQINEYLLPHSFDGKDSWESYYCDDSYPLATTSFAYIKNRGFFYKDPNGIHFIMLNSAFGDNYTSSYASPTNSNYSILQYKLNDDNSNNTITDDGIIDNIFENPETSSIAVVIAFVVVILLGGIGSYFGYKKKKAKNM